MQVAAQADGVGQQPAAVGVERDARLRKARVQRADRLDLFLAAQHAALELEVGETVARVRGLGQAHDGLGRHGLFVAQAEPVVVGARVGLVRQVGLRAVAHVEEVAEHLHRIALLAFAEQRGHGHAQVLAQQVEQRGFGGGHGVDGHAQVEGLQAAPAAVARGKGAAHAVEHGVVVADGLAHDEVARVFERLADLLAARHLAHAGVAGAVGEDQQVAREERAVRAAEVHQHAVVAGHGHDAHGGDDGRARHDGGSSGFRRGHLRARWLSLR
ncbi:hypothetical protein D3C72_1389520 [compost metagenome]